MSVNIVPLSQTRTSDFHIEIMKLIFAMLLYKVKHDSLCYQILFKHYIYYISIVTNASVNLLHLNDDEWYALGRDSWKCSVVMQSVFIAIVTYVLSCDNLNVNTASVLAL